MKLVILLDTPARFRMQSIVKGRVAEEEAVEKAYKVLGVKHSSSNSEINKAYKMKALQNHPDKGGDKNKFVEIQTAMEVIKAARNL